MRFVTSLMFILTVAVVTIYQGCGVGFLPQEQRVVNSESEIVLPKNLTTCQQQLYLQFATGYYPWMREIGCQQCHHPTGQRSGAPFAQDDLPAAFNAFENFGPQTINNQLKSGHRSAELGYNPQDLELNQKIDGYLNAYVEVVSNCQDNANTVLSDVGQRVNLFEPSTLDRIDNIHCGASDPIAENYQQQKTIQWDLGSLNRDLAGVVIKVDILPQEVKAFSGILCPFNGYLVGNIRISSPKQITIKNIELLLNGDNHSVTTFRVAKVVSAGTVDGRFIESASGGFATYGNTIFTHKDIWNLKIEELEFTP